MNTRETKIFSFALNLIRAYTFTFKKIELIKSLLKDVNKSVLGRHSPFPKSMYCADFGPVNIFQFESDSIKPISCIRIKVITMMMMMMMMIMITIR